MIIMVAVLSLAVFLPSPLVYGRIMGNLSNHHHRYHNEDNDNDNDQTMRAWFGVSDVGLEHTASSMTPT